MKYVYSDQGKPIFYLFIPSLALLSCLFIVVTKFPTLSLAAKIILATVILAVLAFNIYLMSKKKLFGISQQTFYINALFKKDIYPLSSIKKVEIRNGFVSRLMDIKKVAVTDRRGKVSIYYLPPFKIEDFSNLYQPAGSSDIASQLN